MKYTILPAQPIPKGLTVYRRSQSLGEHFEAFMAANNIRGYLDELNVEEPIVEEVAAMWLIVVADIQYHRQLEALRLHRIQLAAEKVERRAQKREQKRLEHEERLNAILAEGTAQRKTPAQEYAEMRAVTNKHYDIAGGDSLNDSEYLSRRMRLVERVKESLNAESTSHRTITRKHIVATRSHFSYKGLPSEEWDKRVQIANEFSKEELKKYSYSVGLNEFLTNISPKSEPTGRQRINPYLDN